MISEIFAFGSSPVHLLDPRLRVIFAVLFSVVTAVSDRFPTVCLALLMALALPVLARLPLRPVLTRLFIVNGLVLFIWLVLPWSYEGTPVFSMGPLVISREGIGLSALITIKSNAIVLALIAMVATMPVAVLGQALDRLHIPEKLVHLLLITYRYIFVIESEYHQLLRAARIRSFTPRTDLHTYKTYAYLLGMLFVRAAARGERVHQAMICRGFNGKFLCLYNFAIKQGDLVWMLVMATGLIGLGVLEWAPVIW